MNDNLIENLDDNNMADSNLKEEKIEVLDDDFKGFTPIITNDIEDLESDLPDTLEDGTNIDYIETLDNDKNEDLNDNSVFNNTENNNNNNNQFETEVDFTKLDINNNDINTNDESNYNNSLLEKYGDNLSKREYICNPAIGRENEIKQMILTLLTPEKSAILVGKPGIGKTAIVEGLSYQIQKGNVPDALKDYTIYKLNTSSLLGNMPNTNEPKIQVLLSELKNSQKLILFIDEIHTLIGAGAEDGDSLDFANIFKPGLDRGSIKIIGATTSDEYDRYILTDKAFVRRFQKIEVLEPTKEHTVKILMGSLPKIEYKTGAKLKYTPFIQEKIMTFIVDLTSEYRRVYELSARYPDISLTILQQAFSYAVFDNKKEVSIRDIRKAIFNTKLVYPDVIKKELVRFNEIFSDIYLLETPQLLKGEKKIA